MKPILKIKDKIVIVTGVYDPLTIKDIEYLKTCKNIGDWLIVGLKSDYWVVNNRGGYLQPHEERKRILKELKCVDELFTFNDRDNTDCQLLKLVKLCYPNSDIIYVSQEDMLDTKETNIKGITFINIKQE
jgi:cytidyltransferase-like protein